jgi:hypothetical protein
MEMLEGSKTGSLDGFEEERRPTAGDSLAQRVEGDIRAEEVTSVHCHHCEKVVITLFYTFQPKTQAQHASHSRGQSGRRATSHQELMQKHGLYYSMWVAQLEAESSAEVEASKSTSGDG